MTFIKIKRNLLIVSFAAIAMLAFQPVSASSSSVSQLIIDSTTKSSQEPIEKYVNYNPDFLQNIDLEHEKLLKNIFMVSFLFMLALLIFTMYFYGTKIKKVTNILVLQDDALKSTKDQLIKIINIFNYIDQQIYITDSKGIIEWANAYSNNFFTEKYEETSINLIHKFATDNQGLIFKSVDEFVQVSYTDNLFKQQSLWKMIPIKNSKGEFSNMVFIS